MRTLIAITAAIVATAAPTVALAAENAAGGTIDLTQPAVTLVSLAGAALTALTGWLIKRGADWFGVRKDSELVDQMREYAREGIDYAEKEARGLVADSEATRISIENKKIADAANYVLQQTPKWRKAAKITPAQVREQVKALLPETGAGQGSAEE
jgi:hypothetical protein